MTFQMDGHYIPIRNTLANSKMLIHYIAILLPTLWKLAWRTSVAEIARLSEETAKKWGSANELTTFFPAAWRI